MRRLFTIVIFGALILCFTASRGSAAQPDAKPVKPPPPPPAPTAPVFVLLDAKGAQVGSVFYVVPTLVTALVPIQDSTGVTRDIPIDFSASSVRLGGQGGRLWFESANCTGTPFIESFNFLPAFAPFSLLPDGTLVIAKSDILQTIAHHSVFTGGSCQPLDSTHTLPPGESVGNINNMFPPPYTLIVK